MTKSKKIESQPVNSESKRLGNGQADNRGSNIGISSNHEERCATCNEIDCTLQGKNNRQIKVLTKWITCDLCNQWYHGICQDLQPADVLCITKLAEKGVSWKYSDCRNKTENSLHGESLTQPMIKKRHSRLTT